MPNTGGKRQRTFLEVPPQAIWRPIHYLGSKLRLADLICDLVAELGGGPVCDLFAGSGTVSFALSRTREVLAADIQEYSRVICTALLKPAPISDKDAADRIRRADHMRGKFEACIEPLLEYEEKALRRSESQPEFLCDLVDHGCLISGEANGTLGKAVEAARGRIASSNAPLPATRYFGGRYFSFRQAVYMDSILTETVGETYLAALLSTASTLVNSIGKQFAQPIRPRRSDGTIKAELVRQMCRDRSLDAREVYIGWLNRYRGTEQVRAHRVARGDFRDVLSGLRDVSVIYADPPYTRDHYSRFYHVLETLCLRDCPEVSTTFRTGPMSRGLYRTNRHQSPFCIKSQAPAAFMDLFAGANGVPMLLSYSPFVTAGHPRMMTVEGIAELAKQHYRSVAIVPAKLAHSKLNRVELHREASENGEVFIVCR